MFQYKDQRLDKFYHKVRSLADPLFIPLGFQAKQPFFDYWEKDMGQGSYGVSQVQVCYEGPLLQKTILRVVFEARQSVSKWDVDSCMVQAEESDEDRIHLNSSGWYTEYRGEKEIRVRRISSESLTRHADTFAEQISRLPIAFHDWGVSKYDNRQVDGMTAHAAATYATKVLLPKVMLGVRDEGILDDLVKPMSENPKSDDWVETDVVGVTFEGRQAIVAQLSPNAQVWLRREPHNPYDRNAIRVDRQNGQQIGYINRILAASLAERFDGYGKPVTAVITALSGGYSSDAAIGVRIRFSIPELAFATTFECESEMILIPAGEFLMGSDPKKTKFVGNGEQPQHTLHLPDYYLAKTPVTNAQYLAFVQATGRDQPRHWKDGKPPGSKGNHPVLYVSWHDAVAYCQWLAQVTGKSYRLPSEAEWEKGARGTDGRIFPWGDQWVAKRCNVSETGKEDNTTPVGVYPQGASPYGLLDMAGNVNEWTISLWGEDSGEPEFKYPYVPTDGRENEQAGNNTCRVLRGGSFYFGWARALCSRRDRELPDCRRRHFGFRVAADFLSPAFGL